MTTETLTAQHREYVYSVAMKYLRDEQAAEDVAQEALLLAHRHRASFHGKSRFSTWLYRIAATTSLMHLRKMRRTPLTVAIDGADDDDAPALELRSSTVAPDEHAAAREELHLAARAIEQLEPTSRALFLARFVDGASDVEVGRALKLTPGSVKTRAHRARARVRHILEAA